MKQRINMNALLLIRRFEGLRLTAYRDAAGVWTIGYGHTSMAGPPKVRRGMRVTKAEAEEILRRDVEKFARSVARAIGGEALEKLNENQFGALVSFAYNVGLGNFRRSSVLRAVKEGRAQDVPRLLMRWTKARDPRTGRLKRLRGLVRRRRAEGRLFATAPHQAETAPHTSPPSSLPPPSPPSPSNRPSPRLAAAWAAFFIGLFTIIVTWIRRTRAMHAVSRLLRPLKGWRTLAFSLLVATIGVAEATNWSQLVPDGPARGWVLLAIALIIAWLRVITTTPVGEGAR